MGLWIKTDDARAFMQFNNLSTSMTGSGLRAVKLALEGSCAQSEEEGSTADNSAIYAMLNGASFGIHAAGLVATGLCLAGPDVRYQTGFPGLTLMARDNGILGYMAAGLASDCADSLVFNPLMRLAEEHKDTRFSPGVALQALAVAAKVATVWYTEPSQLALNAVYVSATLVGGMAGATGGLMYCWTINNRAETRREALAPVPDVFQALSAAESGRAADERAALLPHAVAPVSVNIAPKSYGATAAPVDPVPNDEAAAPPAYRDASDLQ